MSAFRALYRESLADAARRRVTPVIVVVCVFSVMMVDGCTACASGEIVVNGESRSIAEVAGAAGLVTMLVLGLWIIALAGLLAADHLRQTLEDGSANLCLARPVSRSAFAAARLAGVLTLAGAAGLVLLGTTAALLFVRGGLAPQPALWAALACAVGSVVAAALSMAASLVLPRLGVALVTLSGVGAIALANVVEAFRRSGEGWLGLIDRTAPPLASAMLLPLASWVPGLDVEGNPAQLALRLLVWAAIALAALRWSFARAELGR